ncbi:hypothetical protein [Thioclava sp. L04-15]|uniref:hypothetical protein n=1 Tax=Thioclava sp. L04-15 TaxID=1915318 RepID=UPI0011BA6362|nr:hypothetical protein [Thioclava sp. L04-15]TNE92494.1 MAG: hypothetical protein EP337_05360 [Paracoccaceae bacterium]
MTKTFTAAQLGQLIASETLSPDSARLRIKNFVAKGYIVTRQRSDSDGRGTLLFSIGDALTAAVLSRMVDLGGLSKAAMQAAATRLQAWKTDSRNPARAEVGPDLPHPPAESPALRLWEEYEAAPDFHVSLHLRWAEKRGAVNCGAYLSLGDGEYYGRAPDVEPMADLLVPVTPLFPELAARIDRMGKAH